jgi:hypothetical protein
LLLGTTHNHYTITAIRFSKTRSATKTDNLPKSGPAVNQKLCCRKLSSAPEGLAKSGSLKRTDFLT